MNKKICNCISGFSYYWRDAEVTFARWLVVLWGILTMFSGVSVDLRRKGLNVVSHKFNKVKLKIWSFSKMFFPVKHLSYCMWVFIIIKIFLLFGWVYQYRQLTKVPYFLIKYQKGGFMSYFPISPRFSFHYGICIGAKLKIEGYLFSLSGISPVYCSLFCLMRENDRIYFPPNHIFKLHNSASENLHFRIR